MSVPRHIEHHSTGDSWNNLPTAPAVIASRCFGDCCGGNSPGKAWETLLHLERTNSCVSKLCRETEIYSGFHGNLAPLHKEMDKCWNTHSGKMNHLGQNHGGMMGDSFLAIQIHSVYLRHSNHGSGKAFGHCTSWCYGWGIPNGYRIPLLHFPVNCPSRAISRWSWDVSRYHLRLVPNENTQSRSRVTRICEIRQHMFKLNFLDLLWFGVPLSACLCFPNIWH